jgi:hypothetical protein
MPLRPLEVNVPENEKPQSGAASRRVGLRTATLTSDTVKLPFPLFESATVPE